ncbi:MAG: hypothetical protein MI974_17360 [Chitinophagales bacterium]|nr:hypothetical protein [Chitinophagales bacterium]
MRKILLIIFLFLILGTGTYAQEVVGQLLGITMIQAAANRSLVNDVYNELNENHYRDHKVYLYRGSNYEINAVCDDDCTNLDLKLYDGMGRLIVYDTSSDALPSISVDVYSTGYFTLRVSMKNCRVEPCRYGFAIYR